MADFSKYCAACGAQGELHRHHLIPRVHGGTTLPTVMLCISCHSLVHDREFSVNHRELTIAGLERAKARGVKLGGRNLKSGFDTATSRAGRDARTIQSKARAADILPFIARARLSGATSYPQLAKALTALGVKPPSGGETWHPGQVWRIEQKVRPAVVQNV